MKAAPEWTKLLAKFQRPLGFKRWHDSLNGPDGRVVLGCRVKVKTEGSTMFRDHELRFLEEGGNWGYALPRWLPDLTAEAPKDAESLARALRPYRTSPERCIVCGRPLNDEASLVAQIGPSCLKSMRNPAPKKKSQPVKEAA